MKHAKIALFAVFVAGLLLVSNVSAATLQGLEWGIEDNDQFNFDFTSVDGNDTRTEIMYFEVTDTPVIPNIMNSWSDLDAASIDVTWANGTSLGWSALMFILYFVAIDHFAVPIGNFTLLQELYEGSIYNGTVFDSGGYWGVELNNFGFALSSDTFDIRIDFLKQDGMLAHWNVETVNGSLSLVRQNLPSLPSDASGILDFVQDNLLLVAGGAVVLLVVIAILCRKK